MQQSRLTAILIRSLGSPDILNKPATMYAGIHSRSTRINCGGWIFITILPFQKAVQYNQFNLDEIFSERLRYRGQIKRLNFDLRHTFILRAPEFFEDIEAIGKTFPFDVVIADVMFTAIPIIRAKLKKPVVTIGVLPLIASSRDLAPAGLGMTPSMSLPGRLKQNLLRYLTDRILFGKSHGLFRDVLKRYNIHATGNTMDFLVKGSTLFLQSGTPVLNTKEATLAKIYALSVPFFRPRSPEMDQAGSNRKRGNTKT